MSKRILDVVISFLGLIISSPFLLLAIFLVWLQDRHSPFYISDRVGINGKIFKMVKIRSMVVNADKSGIDSTSTNDNRITFLGHLIRKYKLDELIQLWNVLIGDMSLVGPRPNVKRETDIYTTKERELLTIKPGITDFASIVFSDEGDILKDYKDPNIAYNQLIRPGKGHLGLFYIKHRSLKLDIKICLCTILLAISKEKALLNLSKILINLKADQNLLKLVSRKFPLKPSPPPGSKSIVTTRDLN